MVYYFYEENNICKTFFIIITHINKTDKYTINTMKKCYYMQNKLKVYCICPPLFNTPMLLCIGYIYGLTIKDLSKI